jgi:hypothetical protein
LKAAAEAEMKALDIIDAVATKIRETPAKTFAGLAVKARTLRFDTSLDLQGDRLPKDQDWPEQVMNQLLAEFDRLASTATCEQERLEISGPIGEGLKKAPRSEGYLARGCVF